MCKGLRLGEWLSGLHTLQEEGWPKLLRVENGAVKKKEGKGTHKVDLERFDDVWMPQGLSLGDVEIVYEVFQGAWRWNVTAVLYFDVAGSYVQQVKF